MCWSGPASLAVATVGVSGSLWARARGAPKQRWLTILYFTGMELLQALTYTVIDQCHLPENQWLTRLSFIHIAFQPFFINIFALSFVPPERQKKALPYVLATCTVGALLMLYRLHVPSAASACDVSNEVLCGADTCSYHGDWHIAWRLYMSTFDHAHLAYWLPAFLLPVLYGSWRWVVYHALVGPVPAFFMTSNKDEMPAIWCLMSIGFLIVTHVEVLEHWLATPLRRARS